MLEKLQDKISEYIESILNKETLTKEDYEVLSTEINRIKFEEQNKERMKSLIETFAKI